MCQVLQVSRSGYYYFQNKPKLRSAVELKMLNYIREVQQVARGSYGTRRIAKALQQNQWNVGRYQARTLMHKAGIKYVARKKFRKTTDSNHVLVVAENLLNRQFSATKPNHKWVSDITYLRTNEGWLYLATVMDLYSRKIVGWAMQSRITADLVTEALQLAVQERQPQQGLMHHSDRGVQYASKDHQALLRKAQITCSMSRKGNCWDNAVMESFFKSFKTEWMRNQVYTTREQARLDVIKYICLFYNSKRLHSTLGYLSPNDFERKKNAS